MTAEMSLVSSKTTNGGGRSSTELKLKAKSTHKAFKNFKKEDKIIKNLGKEQISIVVSNLDEKSHISTNVCKEKLCIAEEYKNKPEKSKFLIDLKQSLLSWFELQLNNEIPVKVEDMRIKAEEIAYSLNNKKFKCTDKWLLDFRISNNIIAYQSPANIDKSGQLLIDWLKQHDQKIDNNNIYIGGTCGLWHSMDLDRFVSATNEQNQVSLLLISNMNGSHKQQLTIVGTEACPLENETKSLPVFYYHCREPLFSYNLLHSCLKIWDNKLKMEQKYILLFLNVNEYFREGLQLEYIQLVCSSELQFVSPLFQRLSTCFKYHYRRLQVMQTFRYSKAINQQQFLEYINLMSLAWHCVSSHAIHSIFHPLLNGCLYFDNIIKDQINNEENDRLSLLQWCKVYDIPIKVEDNSTLDKYIYCDEDLQSIYPDFRDIIVPYAPNVLHMLDESTDPKNPMAIEVFQAMKRLVRYLQSESAPTSIDSAKILEDNLEYGAILEIQQKNTK